MSAVQEPIACHIESSVADAHVASKMMRDLMALAFDSQVTQRQFEVGGAFISHDVVVLRSSLQRRDTLILAVNSCWTHFTSEKIIQTRMKHKTNTRFRDKKVRCRFASERCVRNARFHSAIFAAREMLKLQKNRLLFQD